MNPLWSALAGGVLIGVAALLMLAGTGRVAGISGIMGGLLKRAPHDRAWRVAFLMGLWAGGGILLWLRPESFATELVAQPVRWILAGLLVGVGTALGKGCTSGHGVCGVSRGSRRSIAATLTFVAWGMATATLWAWWGGLA